MSKAFICSVSEMTGVCMLTSPGSSGFAVRLCARRVLMFVIGRFVRTTSEESDRNLTAFQHHKNIYFKACRALVAGEKLRVWYSDDYIQQLHSVSQESINRILEPGEPGACELAPVCHHNTDRRFSDLVRESSS